MAFLGITVVAPRGSRTGNRVTALRWAQILRSLGHTVSVINGSSNRPFDVLIALHAVKTYEVVRQFRTNYPGRPILVTLTGTDVFQDGSTVQQLTAALEMADRVIALQSDILRSIPEVFRSKSRVILQSFTPPDPLPQPNLMRFEVCVLGHLRAVKEPFLAALAVRQVPADSRLHVVHVGGALSPEFAEQARAEEQVNPRYTWIGEQSRREAVDVLARSRVLVMSSLSEGGPSAVSEAVACGVPVLSTPTSGVVGLLGEEYPGYFPFGNARELQRLLLRCETDERFRLSLRTAADRIRPELTTDAERRKWCSLLRELRTTSDAKPD